MYLLLRYCMKKQSIGVAQGALLNLFWILKKCWISVALGILNFDSKICTNVKIYDLVEHFWGGGLTGFQLMADQVILHFDGWWIKCAFTPWRVNVRGSMLLMICRGHIRLSKKHISNFWQLTTLWKNWHQIQNFYIFFGGWLMDKACAYSVTMKGQW